MFATIAIHELVHAAIHPDRGLSERTVLGLWPSRLVFFAHYEGARSKGNFTLGIIAPFLVLAILPLMAAHQFGWSSWILGAVIVLNASVSSADVLGFFIASFGLPARPWFRIADGIRTGDLPQKAFRLTNHCNRSRATTRASVER
jgi:hypothetical protein